MAVAWKTKERGDVNRLNYAEFDGTGAPPNMQQRRLLFDSLTKFIQDDSYLDTKIVKKGDNKSEDPAKQGNRGTYVFSWGAGYHGQLGRRFARGEKKYAAIPMMIKDLDIVIRQVSCGGLHSAFVSEYGRVYTWGDGRSGQLGHTDDPSVKQQEPKMVTGNAKFQQTFITQVACGRNHTMALSDKQEVWGWGEAKYGQLGGSDRQMRKLPRKIDSDICRKVEFIACGDRHTVLIRMDGSCLSFGCGEHGQTGHGDAIDRLAPELIPMFNGVRNGPPLPHEVVQTQNPYENDRKVVIHVSCGAHQTSFVTVDGEVYVCGFGEFLYNGEEEHFFYSPKHIPMSEPIASTACGQSHIVALSQTGNVYTWGAGEYGQLGYGIFGNLCQPRCVLLDKGVAQVSAGRYNSFALTVTGVLYSWGCGENGQLGVGSAENSALPTVIEPILGAVVGQVATGKHHCVVLTSAPWAQPSEDLLTWNLQSKTEQAMYGEFLKSTHRGLAKKDLKGVSDDMQQWAALEEQRKLGVAVQEQEDMQREVNGIRTKHSVLVNAYSGGVEPKKINGVLQLPSVDEMPKETPAKTHDSVYYSPQAAKKSQSAYVTDGAQSARELGATQPAPQGGRFPPLKGAGARGSGGGGANGGEGGGGAQAWELGGTQQAQANTLQLPQVRQPRTTANDKFDGTTNSLIKSGVMVPRQGFLKEVAGAISRMTTVIHDRTDSSEQQLQRTTTLVHDLRKDYDKIMTFSNAKSYCVNELKKEARLMVSSRRAIKSAHSQALDRLKSLEMQLNTATIKIEETGEDRRNYELNIAHLKEEDFEHFTQLEAMRKLVNDNNKFFDKMTNLQKQAVQVVGASDQELSDFRKEMKNYSDFVKTQVGQFDGILKNVRTQNEKQAVVDMVRLSLRQEKSKARMDLLVQEMETQDAEARALTARLQSLDLKLGHFEDAYQKIITVTGVTHPEAIINKFFFKSEIRDQLHAEIEEKQQRVRRLRQRLKESNNALSEEQAGAKSYSWREVQVGMDDEQDVRRRNERAKNGYKRVYGNLALFQTGISSLLRHIQATMKARGGGNIARKQKPRSSSNAGGGSSSSEVVDGESAADNTSTSREWTAEEEEEEEEDDVELEKDTHEDTVMWNVSIAQKKLTQLLQAVTMVTELIQYHSMDKEKLQTSNAELLIASEYLSNLFAPPSQANLSSSNSSSILLGSSPNIARGGGGGGSNSSSSRSNVVEASDSEANSPVPAAAPRRGGGGGGLDDQAETQMYSASPDAYFDQQPVKGGKGELNRNINVN